MPCIVLPKGTRFGRLTVIERGKTKACKHITWRCQCDCGNVVEVVSQALRDGRSKSCGNCGFTKGHPGYNALKTGEASFNLVVKAVRYGAKLRNLNCDLTDEDIRKIVTKPCFYCGRTKTRRVIGKNMNGSFECTGIDRRDNLNGYTLENSVSCCSDCNRAKSNHSFNSFIAWVKKVHKHITISNL